jgi:hypothetical protein
LAIDPLGAWVEVFRETLVLDRAEVLARSLRRVRPGHDLRLADLASRRALQSGVTDRSVPTTTTARARRSRREQGSVP